ncbi:MAG: efflux RND transporter periplasmic adaptor subunit [Candidatus Eisenbacteria bacterium]|nr:efflux RND transporter periplasmic adaptor subunit [Candidatus Eisenbacteria bacterium]
MNIALALVLALLIGPGCQKPGPDALAHAEHDDHPEPGAHADHAAHDDHADHAHGAEGAHGDGPEEAGAHGLVSLTEDQFARAGVGVKTAGAGELHLGLRLTGSVQLNADRVAHVVAKVPGVVREVHASNGQSVRKGQLLARLDSRDLADAKAAYLASRERAAIAESTLAREESLWRGRISSEQDYLAAKQAAAETRIALRSDMQQLLALGLDQNYVNRLEVDDNSFLTRYDIVAPLDGVIIAKHIAVGEYWSDGPPVFTVADLSTVWVELAVFPRDLSRVRAGQSAEIFTEERPAPLTGEVVYVGPVVTASSRTVTARVVLSNPEGHLRPGLFVTARLAEEHVQVPVLVDRSALQTIEGRTCVFVRMGSDFIAQPVTVGRDDDACVELLGGVAPGQEYVATGSFLMKAELGKSEAEHSH